MCRTPDPFGGNEVRVQIKRLATVPSRTDAVWVRIRIADLSSCDGSGNVNLRRLSFYVEIFSKISNTSNPNFGPVVISLDCPFHLGPRVYSKCDGRMNTDQSGKVRMWILDSDPHIQQLLYARKHKNRRCTGLIRNADQDLDAGWRRTCRSGPSGLDPHCIFLTAYHTVSKILRVLKSPDSHGKGRKSV